MSAAVVLDQVTKRYRLGRGEDLIAVDDVSLQVPAGSTVALVGASGSGKSTLLHLIGGMDTCDSGTVTVDGLALGGLSRRQLASYRRRVGFVFQQFHLLPALSALDNVAAPLLPLRTSFDKAARAQELLAAVGLGDRARSLPSRLSGGQQQRVAIARALVQRPPLLLADEPTGNLDSRTGNDILDLLFDLQQVHGTTILLATHDPTVAARCGRIVRLRDGAVIDDTPVEEATSAEAVLTEVLRLRQS